jgi:ATP-dependent Clp protease ATP-binding subunit ClpC
VDEIIVFHALTSEHLKEIVNLQLRDVEKRLQDSAGLSLEVTEEAKHKLIQEGTDPDYGARPLRRTIQRLVEDPLSDMVLRGELRNATKVKVGLGEDGTLVFIPSPSSDAAAAESAAE